MQIPDREYLNACWRQNMDEMLSAFTLFIKPDDDSKSVQLNILVRVHSDVVTDFHLHRVSL